MRVVIQDDYEKMCKWAADYIADKINNHKEERPFVLGLPTGSSPIGVYKNLIAKNKAGELSFKNVVTFNMDEYLGLPHEHDQSYWYFMHDNFFDHLVDMDPANINILNGMTEDPEGECARYEEKIASYGGIDLFMGGIGVDGHLAFNEPFTSLTSRTGLRDLTTDTRIVNSRFFGNDPEAVPAQALSVGIGTVTDAKEVLVLISGHNKARAMAAVVEGGVSQKWTCSALQMHNGAIIACDEEACGELEKGETVMGKYFGTDGFRGEANKTLTFDHAIKIGRYLGWYYGKRLDRKAKVVIGKDTRRSSYMFEYALCTGLMASGADAYIMHVTTTPSVSYIARVDDFDCGIMISASHNPYYDNGIKIVNNNGEKMDEETLLKIEDYLDGEMEVPMAEREEIGRTVDYVSGRNRYIGYLISMSKFSFKDVKVGLDVANGAAWSIAKGVFDALGAKTYVMNDEPDGYNINTNCGSTHIEHLQKFVVDKGLDVGFAYDGDADRCLCVDEKGNVVTGDHILYIYGTYMKDRGKLLNNKVVTTVMSNFGLYKALDKAGIDYEQTKVGDKYVYENMVQNGHRIGGEQSGHIIFTKYATTGDGILTSLKLMEAMLARKKKMSELAAPVVFYPQVLKNVRVKSKEECMNDPDVLAADQAAKKALGDKGRTLLRESGTEPVVRVMAEAPSEEECEKYVDQIIDAIRAKGHLVD